MSNAWHTRIIINIHCKDILDFFKIILFHFLTFPVDVFVVIVSVANVTFTYFFIAPLSPPLLSISIIRDIYRCV